MQKPELTQELVMRHLIYDPESGVFTRKIQSARCTKVGEVSGSIARDGYRQIRVAGWVFREHRIAWLYVHGVLPSDQIDHINGIKTDNRLANLRLATASTNTRNRGPYKTNTVGFKGVTLHKKTGKWQAACWANGKQNFLGLFETPHQASKAYCDFAKLHHGEFFHH